MMSFCRPLAIVIFLGAGSALLYAQTTGRVARPPAQPSQMPAVKQSGDTLRFFGGGQGAKESEAIERAKSNAIQLAIASIAEVLFANPEYAGLYGAQAIGDYVTRVGRFADTSAKPDTRGYRGYASFELKRGYAQISTIREYAIQAQPPEREPWGFFLVPLTLLTSDWVPLRVEVRARRPSSGSFVFRFALRRREDRAVWIRVDAIRVIEDGSAGSTSWSFDIWGNGQRVIALRQANYDDRVGTYSMAADDKSAEGIIRSDDAGYIEFHVIGTAAVPAK